MTDDTHKGPSALDRLPFDPAWIAIGVAGLIIVGAGLSLSGGGREESGPPPAPSAAVGEAPPVATPPAAAPAPAPAAAPPAAPPAPAREAALEARLAAREAEIAALAGRLARLEELAPRLARLEEALPRLAAAEARAERLAALEALRARLEAGRPLAEALRRLPAEAVPAALARFATVAPPTESALRLSFEEAVRAARASAGEGRPAGLGSLMTIRRGEEVLWGDANEAHVQRARRALEAGDLAAALAELGRLEAPYRAALAGWIGQAEGLLAARAALRDLAGG